MDNKKIDFLRRKNSGLDQRKKLIHILRTIGVPEDLVEFLPLEESDAVRQKATKAFVDRNNPNSNVVEKQFRLDRIGEIRSEIISMSSGDVFVLPFNADTVGILKWPASTFNVFWKDLVKIWGDGMIVVDSMFQSKMVVQVINDFGEAEIDIGVWGEEWGTNCFVWQGE